MGVCRDAIATEARKDSPLQYAGRIQTQEQRNPVRCVLEESWETAQGGRETIVKRVWDKSPEVNLDMSLRVVWPSVHPWLLPVPEVDWTVRDILREKGKGNSADVVREVISEFDVYLNIYTDGSVKPISNKAAFAVHIPEVGLSQGYRLPNNVSVFNTEVIALLCALEWVGKIRPQQALICSDSAAALMALQAGVPHARPDLIYEIHITLKKTEMIGLSLEFMWVPAHVGVAGNETADTIAKQALKQDFISVTTTMGFS